MMTARLIYFVVLALAAMASAIDPVEELFHGMDVANMIRGLIDPLMEQFPSGVMSGRDVDIGPDGHAYFRDLAVVSPEAAIDPSKLNPSMLNTKRGLSPDCNNKLCYFYEYALSCKAIGLNMTKICAQYFMGRILGCSVFPSPADFYNAPSICLPELGVVAQTLAAGVSPTSGFVGALLKSNFTVNCHRNCYQNFLKAGISFYDTCTNEINSTHPISVALASFSTFRQQACVFNYQGKNCFSSLYSLTTSGSAQINVFDQYCNYFNDLGFNSLVLGGICGQFTQFGCCYANQVSMLSQDQSNASSLRFFPACVLNYMTQSCPTVSNTVPCTHGLGGNMTFIQGSGSIATAPCAAGSAYNAACLPNFYSKNSTLNLQGVLIGALAALGLDDTELAALHLRSHLPFNVEILSFTYYNATSALINHANKGVPPTLNGAEYYSAVKVVFTYQFAIMGLNQSQMHFLTNKMAAGQAMYTFGVKSQYGVPRKGAAIVAMTFNPSQTYFYEADPIITHKNSASRFANSFIQVSALCSIIASLLVLVA